MRRRTVVAAATSVLALAVACASTTTSLHPGAGGAPVAGHTARPTEQKVTPGGSSAPPVGGMDPDDVGHAGSTAADPVWARVHAMTLADKVRQLMVPSFTGTSVPTGLIRGLHPGGLIYFSANLTSQAQAKSLSAAIQRTADGVGYPLLLMTDQEGSPVTRIPGTRDTPAGATFRGNAGWARHTAERTGRLLSALGVDTDLAPVADVNTAGAGGVIGTRSFGSTPGSVSRLTSAQVCGYHAGGVATTVKHFPGHGSTDTDSHQRTAVIRESVGRWEATDLPPFAAAVHDDVDMIMVGHLAFPALDPSGRPATISPLLNRDLLRGRLGYDGVVITDALDMGGITSWGTPGEIAVRAIQAGDDMLLMPPQPSVAVRAVVAAVASGRISSTALDMHVYRVLDLKRRLGLLGPPKALPHC